MVEANTATDTNVNQSTQVNDNDMLQSNNVVSVSEMDDYGDFAGDSDGLESSSNFPMDEDESTLNNELNSYQQDNSQAQPEQNTPEQIDPNGMNFKERSQYFQSQADLTLNENQRLKEQVALLQQGVSQSPDDVRQQVIQNIQGQAPEPQQPQAPQAPQQPQMPNEFDAYEAQNDSTSDSAKYMQAQTQYQSDLMKYQSDLIQFNVNSAMDGFKQEQQQIAQRSQQENQQRVQQMQIETNLISLGIPKEGQADFGKWLNSAESIAPITNMYNQMVRNKSGNKSNVAQNTNQLQRNRNMPKANVDINNASQPTTAQQGFNMGRKNSEIEDY